jgi:anti-sigma factor RsiW
MQDEILINLLSGADETDREDVFLRVSLMVALRELYGRTDVAADEGAADDGEPADDLTAVSARHSAPSRLRHGWALAVSLAATVMFGGAVMGGGKAPSERANLLDEVALYHEVYAPAMTQLAEIPAGDADRLTAWLGTPIERELTVPDLADAGLRFVGGRMVVVDNRPVAELMYSRDEGLPVAVFVSRIEGKPWSMDVEQHGALHIASWAKDRYAYLVVGGLDGAAVRDLAWRVKVQI